MANDRESRAGASDDGSASWPTRTGVCAHCRRAICDHETCGCDQAERIPFGDEHARRQLAIEVWSDGADQRIPQVALDEQKTPMSAWLLVAGAVIALASGAMTGQALLMVSSIPFVLVFMMVMQRAENKRLQGPRRIARPPGFSPIGAARAPAQLVGASAIVGHVMSGPTTLSPIGRIPCVAFTIELRNQQATISTLLLRDGATTGMSIQTDDDQTLVIAPGPADIINGLRPADNFGARLYLAHLDPLSESSTGPDPFPFECALEAVVQPGAHVRVHNPVRLAPHAATRTSGPSSGYREPAGNVLVPQGTPRIEIIAGEQRSSTTSHAHDERSG